MSKEKYNRISFDEISKYSEPHSIKNFILSDNIKTPPDYSFEDSFIFDGIILGICIKGHATLKVNFKEFKLIPGTVFILLPNQIIKLGERSDDHLLETIFFSFDFISNFKFLGDIQIVKHPFVNVSEEVMLNLLEYHSFIVKQYNRTENPYRENIVRTLLYAMLIEGAALFKVKKPMEEFSVLSRQEEITDNFFNVLLANFKTERSVSFYADKLCLTPKYLSSTIKKVTGKPILAWINDVIIIEIKMQLKTTNLTVLQISEELNFANPSFFGRFFKEHTGMTPLEYRNG